MTTVLKKTVYKNHLFKNNNALLLWQHVIIVSIYWMIIDPHADTISEEIKFTLGPYLNLGVINKNGQIENKLFLGMLGTIPNHEYENQSVFEVAMCFSHFYGICRRTILTACMGAAILDFIL